MDRGNNGNPTGCFTGENGSSDCIKGMKSELNAWELYSLTVRTPS